MDFARQRLWDIQEGKKKYFKLAHIVGCQELDVESCGKGVGVRSLEGSQSQAQNNNKKPAVNPSA